jgi:hypothetical protein
MLSNPSNLSRRETPDDYITVAFPASQRISSNPEYEMHVEDLSGVRNARYVPLVQVDYAQVTAGASDAVEVRDRLPAMTIAAL